MHAVTLVVMDNDQRSLHDCTSLPPAPPWSSQLLKCNNNVHFASTTRQYDQKFNRALVLILLLLLSSSPLLLRASELRKGGYSPSNWLVRPRRLSCLA